MFEYIGVMAKLDSLLDQLIAITPPVDDPSGRATFEEIDSLRQMRNVVDHKIVCHTAQLGQSQLAERSGSTTKRLLIEMGFPPSAASRLMRILAGLYGLGKVVGHAADGRLSVEVVDAVVSGVALIEKRSPDDLSDGDRAEFESQLVSQALSGATPAEVQTFARRIGNDVAESVDTGVPAPDDRSLNTLNHSVTDDARIDIRANVTQVIGEKFAAMIDERAAPRPEPDGADDRRSAEQRRADAFELLLDQAALGASVDSAGSPRTQIVLTIPANGEDPAALPWTGSVTHSTARQVSCDGSVSEIVIDAETVPLQMGRDQRLFPAHLRRAIIIRDEFCIKCGAPPSHTQVHHVEHWSDGGNTDLDNGCLLCQRCHTQVHHHGWDVVMGFDRHPWLVPPVEIDPQRRPCPAYNRRTMRLDDAA
ncbi:HNH endonuclease [Gordonia alkanivorans]|uniref:HNH endonuclease n=1 Tax=Gordonia alkanivorans TaxID=84096 RepID=UPI00069482D3|nr:HNH endonuclease signature motif containing protein [Gordonia alkanivorans]AZZ82260.1 HNH endonuclease [Gordonia alkanivorans]